METFEDPERLIDPLWYDDRMHYQSTTELLANIPECLCTVLNVLLVEFAKQKRSTVEVGLVELCALFRCETFSESKKRVIETLDGLMELRFKMVADDGKTETFGPFVHLCDYYPTSVKVGLAACLVKVDARLKDCVKWSVRRNVLNYFLEERG